MKLRMMTVIHDVYEEDKEVPDGWHVLKATYEHGYWKLLLGDRQPIRDAWLDDH